jgi:UDP-N-acetylglucosamine--N-acetylmuramyl-(pentapeptide) pyrophosphoryl-undecaprenol N-acetylglucosamine transferase
MKVILSGGGTGGHIYPALTIADEIRALRPDTEILFVGTEHGMEKDIVPRAGYHIEFIDIAGFKRSLSLDTVKSVGKLFTGFFGALKLLHNFKPDLVIGTGGYVCGPIVLLAAIARHSFLRARAKCTAGSNKQNSFSFRAKDLFRLQRRG